MMSREMLMAGWVLLGALAGGLGAYLAARATKKFRNKLLSEFDVRLQNGTATTYASQIIAHGAKWKKSLSIIRKPFSKHVNLAIETAALIYAGSGLVNSFVHFEKAFSSPVQGAGTVIFLSMVMAYIPSEWLFSGRVEKEMDAVLEEIRTAVESNSLESYIAQARRNWV